jgi:hypothetical protein
MKKFLWISLVVIIAGLFIYIGIRYYFVLGYGTKAGELNYMVYKGWLFKTYEGKLIQPGLRSTAPNTLSTYEFQFSVTDTAIARRLMINSGKNMVLHYREYVGSVPWRGYSEFVVDSVVSIDNAR